MFYCANRVAPSRACRRLIRKLQGRTVLEELVIYAVLRRGEPCVRLSSRTLFSFQDGANTRFAPTKLSVPEVRKRAGSPLYSLRHFSVKNHKLATPIDRFEFSTQTLNIFLL